MSKLVFVLEYNIESEEEQRETFHNVREKLKLLPSCQVTACIRERADAVIAATAIGSPRD